MSPLARYVVETGVTLVAVIILASLVLVGIRRLGGPRGGGPIELVARLPLDGRRAVYVVRVADTLFVLGAGEGGMTRVGELPGDAIARGSAELGVLPGRFRAALERAAGGRREAPSSRAEGGPGGGGRDAA